LQSDISRIRWRTGQDFVDEMRLQLLAIDFARPAEVNHACLIGG
jgi:hypothetical protein